MVHLPVIRYPSASRLELLDYCRYFPLVPWDQSPPGEAAQTGTVVHSMIEMHLSGEPIENAVSMELADVDKANKMYRRWSAWWDEFKGDKLWFPEVVFLYDVPTGSVRVAEAGWHKEGRPRKPTEIPAVVDALTVADGKGYAIDWKTGKLGNTTAARSNWQLILAALCVHKFFGVMEVEVALGWIRQIKDPFLDCQTHTAMDLWDWEETLRENCEAIKDSAPNPGGWCWKCPGRSNCPAVGKPAPYGVEGVDFPPW